MIQIPCLRRGWKRSQVYRTLIIEKAESVDAMDFDVNLVVVDKYYINGEELAETERKTKVSIDARTLLSSLQKMFPKLEITFNDPNPNPTFPTE